MAHQLKWTTGWMFLASAAATIGCPAVVPEVPPSDHPASRVNLDTIAPSPAADSPVPDVRSTLLLSADGEAQEEVVFTSSDVPPAPETEIVEIPTVILSALQLPAVEESFRRTPRLAESTVVIVSSDDGSIQEEIVLLPEPEEQSKSQKAAPGAAPVDFSVASL